jgi:hypothetical protein
MIMSSVKLVFSSMGNCAWSTASSCTKWAIKKVAGDPLPEKPKLEAQPKLLLQPKPDKVFGDVEGSLKKIIRNLASAHSDSLNNQEANNPQIKIRKKKLAEASGKQRKGIPLNARIFGVSYFACSISGLGIAPGDLLQLARKKDPLIDTKPQREFQDQIWYECSSLIRIKTRKLFLRKVNNEIAKKFLGEVNKPSIDDLSKNQLLELQSRFKTSRDLTAFQEQRILIQTVWNRCIPYIAFHFFAPILGHLIPKVTEFVLKQTTLIPKNNAKNIQNAYSDILKQLLITYSGLSKTATAEEINTKMKEKFTSLLESDTSFETIINTLIKDFRKEFPIQELLNTFITELIDSNTSFQIVLGYSLTPLKFISYLPILFIDKLLDYSLVHLQDLMENKKKLGIEKLYSFLFPLITNLEIIQDAKTWEISDKTQIDRSSIATIVDKSEKYSLEIVKYAHNNYDLLKKDYIKLISTQKTEKLLRAKNALASKRYDLLKIVYTQLYSKQKTEELLQEKNSKRKNQYDLLKNAYIELAIGNETNSESLDENILYIKLTNAYRKLISEQETEELLQEEVAYSKNAYDQLKIAYIKLIVEKEARESTEDREVYDLLKNAYIKLTKEKGAEELLQLEAFAGKAFDLMGAWTTWSLPSKDSRKERMSKWVPSLVEGALEKTLIAYDNPLTNHMIDLTLHNCVNNTLLKGIHKQDLAIKEEYRREMGTFINTMAEKHVDPLFQVKDPEQLKEKEKIFFKKMREVFSLQSDSPFKILKEKCENINTLQENEENLTLAFKEAEVSFFHTLLAYQEAMQNSDIPGKSRNRFQRVSNYLLHINELLETKKPEEITKVLELITKASDFANKQLPSRFESPNTLKLLYFLTRPAFFVSMPVALTYAAANEITNSYYDRNISSLIFDHVPGYLKQAYSFTCGYLNEDQQKQVENIESTARDIFSYINPCLETIYDTGNSLLGYVEKSIRQTPSALLSSEYVKKGASHIIETSIDAQDNPGLVYHLATILLKEVLNKDKLP